MYSDSGVQSQLARASRLIHYVWRMFVAHSVHLGHLCYACAAAALAVVSLFALAVISWGLRYLASGCVKGATGATMFCKSNQRSGSVLRHMILSVEPAETDRDSRS